MPKYIENGTITATNTAEDIAPDNNGYTAVVITIEGDVGARVNFGANASATNGEYIGTATSGGSATFNALTGQRISIYGAMGSAWSIRIAG